MSKAAVGEEVVQAGRPPRRRRASLIVTGTVRADARAPGGYELDVTGLEVVSEAHDYPITPKEHGVDFLMDRRHLWIRAAAAAGDPARPARGHQRRPRLLQRRAASSSPTRRSSRRRRARARRRCSRSSTSRTRRRTSRRAASSTTRPTRWRSARSTASARRSAPRSRRRAATSPSSGWSSRRWPTPTSTT